MIVQFKGVNNNPPTNCREQKMLIDVSQIVQKIEENETKTACFPDNLNDSQILNQEENFDRQTINKTKETLTSPRNIHNILTQETFNKNNSSSDFDEDLEEIPDENHVDINEIKEIRVNEHKGNEFKKINEKFNNIVNSEIQVSKNDQSQKTLNFDNIFNNNNIMDSEISIANFHEKFFEEMDLYNNNNNNNESFADI